MTANTARKEDTVTIPRAEYERLVRLAEDAEDRAALATADPADALSDDGRIDHTEEAEQEPAVRKLVEVCNGWLDRRQAAP